MKTTQHLACIALCLAAAGVQADALQDATSAVLRKDYVTAARLFEPLAHAGDAQAQLRLGLLYYHGHGVRESDTQAAAWFQRAATQGLAEAQFQFANMVLYGLVPAPDSEDPQRLAARWTFEAARQGHAEAQYSLAVLFLTGSGVTLSAEEARKWMARAAAQGHADAMVYLRGPPQ